MNLLNVGISAVFWRNGRKIACRLRDQTNLSFSTSLSWRLTAKMGCGRVFMIFDIFRDKIKTYFLKLLVLLKINSISYI
uniref:Uncharacterized protein n=1 Tax=Anguilla anguilla TaxID=7936 RepID=A0A0E9RHS0_ANGAN